MPAAPPLDSAAAAPATASGRPLTPTVEAVRGALRPPATVQPPQTGIKSIQFRQTAIPPLLVGGLLLLSLGLLPFITPDDSAFAAMKGRAWVAFFFMAVGVLMLIMGFFNMMAVKQQLAARDAATASPPAA